jgi:patatin-like phospholipase/acyl hydrolase
MPGDLIRLSILHGGGIRGLSSLMILQQRMATVNPDSPLKLCDHFDIIGSLIAWAPADDDRRVSTILDESGSLILSLPYYNT